MAAHLRVPLPLGRHDALAARRPVGVIEELLVVGHGALDRRQPGEDVAQEVGLRARHLLSLGPAELLDQLAAQASTTPFSTAGIRLRA